MNRNKEEHSGCACIYACMYVYISMRYQSISSALSSRIECGRFHGHRAGERRSSTLAAITICSLFTGKTTHCIPPPLIHFVVQGASSLPLPYPQKLRRNSSLFSSLG
jgi:hypothetical protein